MMKQVPHDKKKRNEKTCHSEFISESKNKMMKQVPHDKKKRNEKTCHSEFISESKN